jgi:hypothetical protein
MAGIMMAQSAQPGQIITTGLQLRLEPQLSASYPGSGTSCYDLSPNHYTTTLVNGVTYSTARAPSFGFNGATNNRYINTGQYLSYETYTLSSWFKSSTTTTFQMLFSKEQTAGWPWNYRLFLNQTTGYLTGDLAINGSNFSSVGYNVNLCNGVWHNAIFVRNVANDTLYLYVDGNSVATATDTTVGATVNNQNVYIGISAYTSGGANPNGSYPMNGQIGQSLIYNIALTADQVKQNFNAMRGVYGV